MQASLSTQPPGTFSRFYAILQRGLQMLRINYG